MSNPMNSESVSVYIHAKEHANLDSFSLRYGYNYPENTVLNLRNCRNWIAQDDHKYRFEADFDDLEGRQRTGIFVGKDQKQKYLKLVTVIRGDIATENQLSDHLKKLRVAGQITPEELKQLNEYYEAGEANSVSGLIATIKMLAKESEELAQQSEAKAKAERDEAISRADEAISRADEATIRADEANSRAEELEGKLASNNQTQGSQLPSNFDEEVKRVIKGMEANVTARPDPFENNPFSGTDLRQRSNIQRIDQSLVRTKITKIYGPPGTGKTTKLIALLRSVIEQGVSPNDIGFFAFTNFATSVARDRVVEAFPEFDLEQNFDGFRTLHSLAHRMLPVKVNVMNGDQAKAFDSEFVFEEVMLKENDPDSLVTRAKQVVVDAAAVARSRLESFEEYLRTCSPSDSYRLNKWLEYPPERCERQVFEKDIPKLEAYVQKYEDYKKKLGVIDYTDILELGCQQQNSIPTFRVIFIDEAQDLSKLQWALAEKLFQKADQIFLAGDDDQAICESFGAAPNDFVEYQADQEDVLQQSYRVPLAVHDYLFAPRGIIAQLSGFFTGRKDKEWRSKATNPESHNGLVAGLNLYQLSELLKRFPKKDWLILAATHLTLQKVSRTLKEVNVSHILSNRPVMTSSASSLPTIRLATVWGAKGGEADISVLMRGEFIDEKMYSADPRLVYVARTRTKSVHFEIHNTFSSPLDTVAEHIGLLEDTVNTNAGSYLDTNPSQGPVEGEVVTRSENSEVLTKNSESLSSRQPESVPASTETELGLIKLKLEKLNKRSDEFEQYKKYAATLVDIAWTSRGPRRALELIMSDGSRRAKLWDLEQTYEVMTLLRGHQLVTAPVNPSRNSPLEWFNDVYLVEQSDSSQSLQSSDDEIPF